MFMELALGQYAALGPVAVYRRFCPLFRGLGYGMIIVSGLVMLYYNLIIGWTIYYMASSLKAELPWQHCEEDWSTKCKYKVCAIDLFADMRFWILQFVFPTKRRTHVRQIMERFI